MPNIIRFSKAQQGQLKLAKEAGVDTECLFHPEWGPVLMNTCWNRESRNESTFPIHKAAAYLSEYFPMKDGVLFDEPLTIFYAVKMFKHGATPMAPPKKTDGTPDMPMFTFIRKRDELLAGGAYRLYSGRVSINDVHWLDMPDILAEGIPDALHIIHALQARAVITTRPDGSRYEMPAGDKRQMALLNIHVMDKMGSYYFESLVNHILALYDDALLQSASPHYHLYADWVDNGGLLHAAGWLAGEEPRAQVICNAVFTWLRAPKDVIESYMVAGPAYMNSPEDQDAYQKLKKKLSGNDPVGRKIAEAYELPDPRELPVKLPWLS